ncbi:c-type cytochrome [Chelativorans sp. M5D2P16]|uniref:c-type cytochrome n=1 Tax=Chelativorans sp. M5D2P16 TaxID=3095678 RepID=UPI002ACA3134|nr:c-type cytochrome [Chelativorans sp. M5D2P16]MDZ5696662.1 c-type cytochrome [Chelativorans sp. M5D2P16]
MGQRAGPAGKRWVRMMAVRFKRPSYSMTRLGGAGIVALWTVVMAQIAGAQQADGERAFRQRCASCHSLETDRRSAGPSLAGVIGREAGSLEGARYSQALQGSALIWDADTLDRFLSDPNETVPGTTMRIRVTDPAQRQAIIEFLEGF